jgi:hypothetical protein
MRVVDGSTSGGPQNRCPRGRPGAQGFESPVGRPRKA